MKGMVPHSRFELAQSRLGPTLDEPQPPTDTDLSILKPEFDDWDYET